MFVWSETQARLLLGGAPPGGSSSDSKNNINTQDKGKEHHKDTETHVSHDDVEAAEGGIEKELWVGDKLLDLGAGDGYVTQVLEGGAGQVYATETSSIMRKRLRERGYR